MRPLRAGIGMVAVALAATLGVASGHPAVSATASFSPSGISGGGFITSVSVAPSSYSSGDGDVLAGGDTSGIYLSTNHGTSWQPIKKGLTNAAQTHVAAVACIRT